MHYLDHAATTPVRPEVLEEMLPYLKEMYGKYAGLPPRKHTRDATSRQGSPSSN